MASTELPKQLKHRISSAVHLDLLLAANSPAVPNAKDYLIFILSLINPKSREYKQISSTLLQQIVDNYRQLLDWLIAARILESDNRFIKGEKCKGYRYCKNFRTTSKFEYITKPTLIRKVVGFRNKLQQAKQTTREEEEFLYALNYGYQPIWLRAREVADKYGLKSTMMAKGFRALQQLGSPDEHQIDHHEKMFLFEMVKRNGKGRPALRINEDFLHVIEEMILQYPSLFPKK